MIKYCGKELTPEQITRRRKKARRYFEALGINPDVKGSMYQERRLDMQPKFISICQKQQEELKISLLKLH